jgi:hypothetical protein
MADDGILDFQLRIQGPEGTRTFDSAAVGLRAFAKDIGEAVSVREVNPIIAAVLKRHLTIVAEAMAQRHSTPWAPGVRLPSGARTGKLAVRSGKAITQLRDIKINARGVVTGTIGGPFYLNTHEEGKTIRAKGAYMTIPLPAAMDSHGVPLKPSLRQWDNTFLMPLESSKTGRRRQGFLVAIKKGGRVVPIYLLVKTVRIPQRLGLGITLKKAAPALVDRVLNALAISVATKAITGKRVNPRNFGNF